MPLNDLLYQQLKKRFGRVRIVHEGIPMSGAYVPSGKNEKLVLTSPGEYYVVDCPFCGDTKQRLWINHMCGVKDPRTGTRHRFAAICYNENCLADEENRYSLFEEMGSYLRKAGGGGVSVQVVEGIVEDVPIALPDDYVRLKKLPPSHPARQYVQGRGFDPDELSTHWGVGFSESCAASWSQVGRLVIPIRRIETEPKWKFVVWGWQSRSLLELELPKYRTAGGFKKSRFLYGEEQAVIPERPVVVCEGATDVWRYGCGAIAMMGKTASQHQLASIGRIAFQRPVVVALDSDALADAEKLADAIREARAASRLRPDTSPVGVLKLPKGQDPADLTRSELQLAVAKVKFFTKTKTT